MRKTGRPVAQDDIEPQIRAAAAGLVACPHRPPCPGCPRFGAQDIDPAAMRALADLARVHGLPEAGIDYGARSGFRMRARLAIRGRVGSPKLGLFELDSHRVVHIPNCSVHHPLINRVASVVRRALVETGLTSYSDRAHLGVARYLQVVIERSSQTAQVVLVANCETSLAVAPCLDLIRDRLGDDLHSLWFNRNRLASNTILGADFERWCGPDSVVERFGGAAVYYPPGAFGQNNLEVAEHIIAYLRTQIPQGAQVAEFYAGVGAIGLSILHQTRGLVMNEVSPHSLRGLELGLAQLDVAERAKISVLAGEAGTVSSPLPAAEVVIADPPRKGLDPRLLEHLRDHPPQRFLYVSCGLDSLRSDAAQLVSSGALQMTDLRAFDLMPYTHHIETVSRFEHT